MTGVQTCALPISPAPAAQAAPDIAEPKKRDEKKAEPTPKKDIKAVLGNWASDDS